VFVGSENDVLGRYYECAQHYHAEIVVRIMADCPLRAGTDIDDVIRFRDESGLLYAGNCFPPTLPDGLDTEAFTFDVLELAHYYAKLRSEREHVTPWLRSELAADEWGSTVHTPNLALYRLCLDVPADFEVLRQLFIWGGATLTWQRAVELLDEHPELAVRNQSCVRNAAFIQQRQEEGVNDV
jgi:spore coat polysaccharide biosynthesis protein SpsF (cytidylyltransferase family)